MLHRQAGKEVLPTEMPAFSRPLQVQKEGVADPSRIPFPPHFLFSGPPGFEQDPTYTTLWEGER